MQEEKRIKIVTGHYGSGKTEFAVNYALNCVERGLRIALVDLDIMNPYFRSRETRGLLEKRGVKVIASSIADQLSELPALSPEITAVFQNKSDLALIDAGGNGMGVRVLGRYHDYLDCESFDIFFVLNANRPMTNNLYKALELFKSIEDSMRRKITCIVNNTHLCNETTEEDIIKGQSLCFALSEKTGLPVAYTMVHKHLIGQVTEKINNAVLPVDIYLKKFWEI